MSIEKRVNVDGSYHYQPKSTLRRYSILESGISIPKSRAISSASCKKQGLSFINFKIYLNRRDQYNKCHL